MLLTKVDFFLLYVSMNYRDLSVSSKSIISLIQTIKLLIFISLFQKWRFFLNRLVYLLIYPAGHKITSCIFARRYVNGVIKTANAHDVRPPKSHAGILS